MLLLLTFSYQNTNIKGYDVALETTDSAGLF